MRRRGRSTKEKEGDEGVGQEEVSAFQVQEVEGGGGRRMKPKKRKEIKRVREGEGGGQEGEVGEKEGEGGVQEGGGGGQEGRG